MRTGKRESLWRKPMAKWKVEQRKFDPAKEIWSGDGLWEVQAKSAEEALVVRVCPLPGES